MTRLGRLLLFSAFLFPTMSLHARTNDEPALETSPAQTSPDLETSTNRGLFNDYNTHNLKIRTDDGYRLDARLYDPKLTAFSGRRPAIIFTNSWTLSEYEYEVQARKFASKGYIVLSYASRGFGGSEGYVSVAGPDDIRDFSTVIDWLEANTRVDNKRIGMAGVSYGGGLALLAAAFDSRIKVVASMSGWGNLEASLYRNETIQQLWLNILLGSGKIAGRLAPDIHDQVEAMEKRTDIAATRAWAKVRSPETYIDAINARNVPIFLQNSYLDALFPPLQIRPFYEKLSGPKRMMTDEGLHATSAIPGLLGVPSKVWSEVHNWLDHFLIDDSIPIRTGVSFQNGLFTDYYREYPELSGDRISMQPLNRVVRDAAEGRSVVRFTGGKDSGAHSGFPILSDMIDSYTSWSVKKIISTIDEDHAAVFQSGKLSRDIKVQGSTKVRMTLMPHEGPVTLVAYLFDENAFGVGSLATFSVASFHESSLTPREVVLDLNTTSYKVDRGHRLTLVIDTIDSLYSPARKGTYRVSLAADDIPELELPLAQ